MGEFTNKTLGKAKTIVGKATRNRSLEAKGRIQTGIGKVQGGGRKVKRTLRNAKSATRGTRPSRKTTVRATMGRRGVKATKTTRSRSY